MMRDLCPVCGLTLDKPAWGGDLASFQICPCCGTQFGYEDSGPKSSRQERWRELRQRWIDGGMNWWSDNQPPEGWDAKEQLARVAAS